MQADLEEKLVTAYPELFHRIRTHPVAKTRYYGCDCGDGWFTILNELCGAIARYLRHERELVQAIDFKILQIKEKFGGLRFYYKGGDKYIAGLVDMAEELAAKTCEVTGKPGRLCRKPSGWLVTLCPEEAEKIGAVPYEWQQLKPPQKTSN